MASSQHVEVEAAKFLHKLIQESKDEPAKLATKLYVICQHMKMSGKEQSLPYQVISRAMETVITQHRLDIDVLRSSRLSLGSGSQTSEAKDGSFSRTTQNFMLSKDGKEPVGASEPGRVESLRQDIVNQGSISQSPRSGKSLERESSASVPMEDSKSGNSQEMQAGRKEVKKVNAKRKRADSKESSEILGDDSVQLDSASTRFNSWKGKQTGRVIAQSHLSVKGGEHSHASSIQQSAQMGQGSDARRQFKDVDERDTNPNPLPLPKTEKATRDIIGGATTSQPTTSKMPFKEHHLKQLRAQCLVFLAFRNNVPPRKLHLEIALGEKYPKEGGSTDLKGKSTSLQEHGHYPESPGTMMETEFSSKDTDKKNQSKTAVEQRLPSSKQTTDISQLKTESRGPITSPVVSESVARANRSFSETKPSEDVCNRANQLGPWSNQQLPFSLRKTGVHAGSVSQIQHDPASVGGINTQEQPQPFCVGERTIRLTKPEFPILETNVAGDSSPSLFEAKSQVPHFTTKDIENLKSGMNPLKEANVEKLSSAAPEIVNRIDKSGIYHGNGINGLNGQRTPEIQKHSSADGLKTIIYSDVSRGGALGQVGERSTDHDEECSSMESVDAPLSPPKLTTSEKWIFEQQKRKREDEEKWTFKQRKAEEQIAACFEKLTENVNASEDISTRTKSVIELKKLQLLQVQRRLRRDFLSDFFKPISSRMEHLKSVKKHRHGRKIKQLERFEQKMKEERLKRIRERQKEFFGEIEAHKERLEDYFKIKRERCKGVNRYVKEFHKRKERIHREKIDRIQREKINLLKANDVEGYLRMVQDAKSDRVKQLLKETEKYLQKLGAKIKDAKSAARLFGGEVETSDVAMSEKSEVLMDPEDESDQAQHYLESNEKYYLMAHSVKETIEEQPVSLRGGKLREYQMNGLRWLVSLYNNHLNGILADEMGLGKTVQVISLICYLMETKNDRGPFLVVVPSSVLPGWETEINFWAPEINKIMYSGTPEERRRLFKERIAHQKFNVLLTTYEYLMNKHDRPKLSKIDWHYVIIDEGHRIKNASCKLNADLKHYRSNHRLLLTGTPLQNNLEELWALLNFLLPDIFNSAEDFSQWFNKPFQSNSDNSPDEALLSEEENLLIINRLHQVLRPFVLRRLKHKVENELPEKIERLIRCEASAYQKLLMKRVEDNLGSIGPSKGRSVHNTVMELRNICNHPYLSQLHSDEVDALLPKHYLPPLVRLCGKLEMVDRLLPKLKATGHRVLFFSTMTRLLDVMEEYLHWKHYRYLRLDGHTSGNDRGALIKEFNRPDSSTFIFLLSIRAGGVGVNLQAADTVMIFDTDWNPQVDLQAQARAHRIGQKRDVLVLRLETVNTVEEQVRAAAEHKLGVANQSITAGFFDNNTSAEDRREYLESLLRECKKEEAAPVLDDDALNYLLARSEAEIDVFESLDRQRREQEAATWQKFTRSRNADEQDPLPMPPRLVTDEDLEPLYKALRISEVSVVSLKRKGDINLDTQHYGRGKRAREVRSYEDQWTEEEFEKLCQADSPGFSSPKLDESLTKDSGSLPKADDSDGGGLASVERLSLPKDPQSTPVKRGRGRPKRSCEPSDHVISQENAASDPGVDDLERSNAESSMAKRKPSGTATTSSVSLSTSEPQAYVPPKGLSQKMQTGESSRGRAKKSSVQVSAASLGKTRVSKSSSDSQTGFELAAKTEESVSPQLIEQSSILPVSEKVEIIKDESAEKLKAEGSTTSVPALARHVSEKKNSVTSKKAAAREARTMSSSAQDVRSRSTGSKKRNPKPLRLKLTSDSDDKDAEKSSASHDSVVTLSNQKRESSSKSVSESCMLASPQRGNSDENPEILHQKASTFIGESFPKEKDSESSEKAVQDGCIGENIAEPPADQLTSETSLTVESSVEPVPGKSDHLNVSSQVHADGAVEMSVVDMHPTSSGIKDAIVTKDGSVVESGRDGLIVPLCPVLSVPRIDQESSRPVDPQPPHIESQDNKEDFDVSGSVSHSADALCDHDEDENVRHALHDNNQNYGALASAGSPEDSTCIKDGGNDINLSSQVKDQDLDASASVGHSAYAKCDHDEDDDARLASQDKNPKYGAFASAGKPEDDTCIKDGSNDTSLSSQVKDQDLDASASVDHSADATCNHDEDDDVRLASQDKNENYGAVASVGHSEDATCVKDDTSLSSQVKNQDCDASAPEGDSSDATCAKDEGNDASLESQDDNKVLNVSASESHSADATCDSGVRLASQDENRNCDAPAAVAHSADDTCETGVHLVSLCENRDYDEPSSAHSADDTCIKEEGDDVGLVSQDEIQDHDASALDGHSAYDTCTVHEGNDVSVASPVKFQDHDASASYMHSADGACLASEAKNEHNDASVSAGHSADATHAQDQENEINVVSEDKVEDYGASISACQSADATCIKDVRNHIGHASPDEDHNSYASISERHSADATCTRDEGNDASLAPPDKSQDDPTASEGHSADATCANDVGNDVSLVSQDKNQDCNASVSGGHSADAMCIEENDVSLSSLDKNEDPDASASGSHSADDTCVSYEGTDACTLSQDKNEDPTASTSEGHSADATSLSPEANDFNLSAQDKMQDPNASASEGHSADATCIKDEGYDGCILSQDKDQDLTASAGGGHSADASCISHEGNDVRLTSQDNNEIPDASGSEDHSADATCIKEEGDHASILFLDKKEDPNASASGGYSADATSSNPEGNDVSLQDPHASASMGHSADATWASHASDEVSLPSQDQSADPDATASGDHSADASHEGNEDSLPLRDQNEDPDASASGAQSADATCAGREGNEDSLPLQDQNEDPDASASGGQLADATCAGRESNGDSLPLRDENEDPYASADATCASHEGNEVTLPLQDRNEDADVSGSGGQSADAMCHNHEGDDPSILSRVKNQDPTASASEGHSADATCTEDADPSASEGHSADARGIKDEDNDIDSVKSLPQGQASDPSECAKNAEKDPRGITADVSTAPSPPAAQDEHAHTPDEPKLDVSLLRADVHLPSSSSSSPPEQPIAGVTGPASPLEEEDQMPPHASEGASSG